ncbi:MAG: hypothetical protein DCF20_11575 [Pseudanabaena sp.]|nr:MAG: hypothetical protein DCF20_11575 [Pseudanabaena sp.]
MRNKNNKYDQHLLVLPEDRANEEIANGFNNILDPYSRAIQIERPSGGWGKVVDNFAKNYVSEMRIFTKRMIVLLIDFDDYNDLDKSNYRERLSYIKSQIPDDLQERVFVLGSRNSPEKLRSNMKKSFEGIGESLAKDCAENTNKIWGHDLLKHNEDELERLRLSVKPFLFN